MPHRRTPRPLLAVAALALTVTLGGCGDDASQPQSAPSSAPASDTSSPTREPQRSPSRDESPEGPVLALRVAGDEVAPTAETIRMSVGDVLTVSVDSDRAGELHVHSSPEQYVDFGAGRSRHRISLDKPGQVDVEEHESGVLVARLLVS